jgi:hypothetical protein
MKKLLITLIVLLTAFIAIGQEAYFMTVGLDPKLAIKGAYNYDKTPVLDIHFKTGTRLANGIEVGVGFEYANLNPSYAAGKFYINKVFFNWRENVAVAIGAEAVMIDRSRFGNNQKINPVYTYGLNTELRWYFMENTSIDFAFGLLHREDLKQMYQDKLLFKPNGTISITFQTKR